MILEQVGQQAPHNLWRAEGDPRGRHSGEDTGWGSGDDVYAAGDGVVEYVYTGDGYNSGWGRRIVIRHSDRSTTTYNHFDAGQIRVRPGDRVKARQYLGRQGTSGKVTAKHVHHEVYVDGRRVNPRPYHTSRHVPGTEPVTGTPAGSANPGRAQRVVKNPVRRREQPTSKSANPSDGVKPLLSSGTVGNFTGFIRGEKVSLNGVTTDLWYRGISGDYFWAGNFTTPISEASRGLKDLGVWRAPSKPAPAKPKPKDLGTLHLPSYYWYDHPRDAEREVDVHGGKYDGRAMLSGPYDVIDVSSGGAFKVRSKANGLVWVSPRARKYRK